MGRGAGWQRADGIGNNGVRTAPSPLPREHYQTVWATDESIRWLREHGKTGPFFLMTSYVKPHAPHDPPAPYGTMYDPHSVPRPFGGPEVIFGSYEPAPRRLHAARTARWQYVFHEAGGYEELYDIAVDPQERRNLAGLAETREAAADLRRRTAAWLVQLGDREALGADGDLKVSAGPDTTDPPMTRLPLGLRPY